MVTTTLTVLPKKTDAFGFNTTPTQTVNTVKVDPSMDPYGVSAKTPTTAPTAPVAPAPTIGETLTGIKNEALRIQDILNTRQQAENTANNFSVDYEKYPTYEELYPEIDEDKIRRNQLKLFQGEIDATNRIYDEMLNQERLRGTGRLGTQTAIAARGGLLGSDFGESQRQGILDVNKGQEGLVQAERSAKIGAIMGEMRKSVADEIAAKRQARNEGADNYIKYLAGAQDRKASNLQKAAAALMTQGLDPTTMRPEELDAIGKEAGLSAQDILMTYQQMKATQEADAAETDLKTRKTEADIAKIEADIASGKIKTIGEGTMLYNTETGETFKNPKTYAPGTGSSSSISLTGDDKRTLLGGGWSESDIAAIENDVRANGLDAVIAQAKVNGATSSQISALQKAYGATGDSEQFLTKDFFKQLFGDEKLSTAAKEAGAVTGGEDWVPFNEAGDTEAYLTQLESLVGLYRQAGYTDQEILKMMQ